MLLYVSGPYSGDTEKNILQARDIAAQLWEMGHAVICPHTNTALFERIGTATYDQYIAGDLQMIARCDGLVMTPDWKASKGANIEFDYATSLGIPVWVWPESPEVHITEKRCPAQVKAFAEILGKMYRVHLDKNADYSPANIIAMGEVGLVTRLWDKTARLMNLVGIRFKSLIHEGVVPPRQPKNEAIEDTFMDLAVYAIIGLLLRRGVWGK